MKIFGAALLLVLSLNQSSPADILIYKGTTKVIASADVVLPLGKKEFYIIDTEERLFCTVGLEQVEGRKQLRLSQPSAIDHTFAAMPKGRTATVLSHRNTVGTTGAESYLGSLFVMRGINSYLVVRNADGQIVEGLVPRVLTLKKLMVSSKEGEGVFEEFTGIFSFLSKPSIEANNAGLTISEARSKVIAQLREEGYYSSDS